LGALVVAALLVSFMGTAAVRAQADQPATKQPTDAEQVQPQAEQVPAEIAQAAERAEKSDVAGFPTGHWIEFGDTKDWIRFTSGEWLQGDLNWMRDGDFEFDSDKLDIVKKAWSDVEQLHSPRIMTYVFKHKIDAMGRGMITKDKVIVETEEGVKTFPRSELLSILEGGSRERDWWMFKIGAGFTGALGNSNQGSVTASFGLARQDERTSTVLRYDGTFGFANGEQNVNRHLGQVGVGLFVSDRFYVVPAAADLFHDRFANIKFRATPATLGGIHVFDEDRVEWDFEFGLGYQFLRVISTLPNTDNPQSDGFVPVRSYWEFDIADDIDLDIEWQSNIVYTTIGNTNHVGKAIFSIEVTDIFSFDTEFDFFRTERPIPRADGTVPQRNDYQLIVGFSIRAG
jgi:hypothetical protein